MSLFYSVRFERHSNEQIQTFDSYFSIKVFVRGTTDERPPSGGRRRLLSRRVRERRKNYALDVRVKRLRNAIGRSRGKISGGNKLNEKKNAAWVTTHLRPRPARLSTFLLVPGRIVVRRLSGRRTHAREHVILLFIYIYIFMTLCGRPPTTTTTTTTTLCACNPIFGSVRTD